MSWPDEPFLNLRQTTTPNGTPANGGALLYVKSDGKLYLKNASGVEAPVETTLGDVTLNGTQALTNKDLTDASNSFPASLCTDTELATHAALSSSVHGLGALSTVVGTTTTQTLTSKTLSTGTKVGAATTDISGAWTAYTPTNVNVTLGNGTVVARYMQIGKTVSVRVVITGGTTSSGSSVGIGLPVSASSTGQQVLTWASAVSGTNYAGVGIIAAGGSTAAGWVQTGVAGGGLTQAGFGNGFVIEIQGTYEAA